MRVIDSQVHAYERDHPGRPWHAVLHGPEELTGGDMVAAMDAAGVDGALLVSPFTMYRYDASYALEVGRAHADRCAVIAPFDPDRDDVAGAVAAFADEPGTVGVRLILWRGLGGGDAHEGVDRIFVAAARHGMPVNVLAWGRLPLVGVLARRHPDTSVVIDHVGMTQRFEQPPPVDPFGDLPELLALADLPNVSVKISGAGTLSHEPYPFDDIWPPLERIFAAFGLDRCLWGSDWTRATAFLTYEQAVEAFRDSGRLSPGDLATLMGGALERIYGWTPRGSAPR